MTTTTSLLRLLKGITAPWKLAFVTLSLLSIILGYRVVKYNTPNLVDSAKKVPSFMIDQSYGKFTDEDMQALRRGACSSDPIEVSPMADGTAIMTCGIPVQPGPVRLFIATSTDMPSLGLR
jgi:hypothetical protein